MTTRTRETLICDCGHQGFLLLEENDQPYSSLWARYSLEGFDGSSVVITKNNQMPKDLLASLKPTCPECGQTGKVQYA